MPHNVVKSRKWRILFVEDNPDDVELTVEAFRHAGLLFDFNVTENAADALNFLRKKGKYAGSFRPHLIILDLKLPGMSGFDFLKIINEDDNLKDIPIIVLSVLANEDDILKVYELNAKCYIAKPVDMEKVMDTLIKSVSDKSCRSD